MSAGDLKTDGLKGNNFPWQLKMLKGQQCACDYLEQISLILQGSEDYEAMLVVDANDITWLEIRIYNPDTGTFDPPVYYAAGSNTPGTPTAPITYINPNTYLATILTNITNIVSQLNVQVKTPTLIRPNNTSGVILAFVKSISFACPTSASAESYISTDGGLTTIALYPGETVHYDAGALNNRFNNTDFTYDTTGSELLISYIV